MNLSLEDYIPEILDPEDDHFSKRLAERYEFSRYGANKKENLPKAGGKFPHQNLAAMFYNIYQRGLIAAQPGTGKTCYAVAITETALDNQEREGLMMKIDRVYVVGMPTVNSNFQRELVCRCTHHKYIDPLDAKTMTVSRINKAVRQRYNFMTLNDFNKFLESHLNDESRDSELEGALFIIDEAHILVIESADIGVQILKKKTRKVVYENLLAISLRVPSMRAIYMTGTPMRNSPNELALLLNLVLKSDLQFKTNPTETKGIEITNADNWDLWDRFKGNISYIRETERNFKLDYLGVPINDLLKKAVKGMENIIYPCVMRNFQRETYYNILKREGRRNVYSKVRQAAIIVYPNCSVNKFNYYIDITTMEVKDEFKNFLGGFRPSTKVFIHNLAQYSAKFSAIAEYIVNNPEKKGIIYQEYKFQGVFSLVALLAYGLKMEVVDATLLTGIREEAGYCGAGEFTFDRLSIPKRPRIAYLVPSPHLTDANREALIALYNSPANYKGEYIRWLVFSPVGREGLSFKDVTTIITDVSWSFSIDEQARRRGIRANSHDRLFAELGDNNLVIDIIQLAIDLGKIDNRLPDSQIEPITEIEEEEIEIEGEEDLQIGDVPDDVSEVSSCDFKRSDQSDIFNIDLYMYVRAEEKERVIRPYRELYKEMAYDGFVHRFRNQQSDLDDYSIECDFRKCRYDCYTVEEVKDEEHLVLVDPLEQEYNISYEWFWSHPDLELVEELKEYLGDYFHEYNTITFDQISKNLGNYPFELIISALIHMAEKMELFENRLGFKCFLAFTSTAVALVPRPQSKFEEYLYFEEFRFQIKSDDLRPIINEVVLTEKEDELDKIFTYNAPRAIRELVRLSSAERNALLEKAYIFNNKVALAIREHYKPRTFKYKNLLITTQIGIETTSKHSLVNTLLKPTKFRVFDNGKWRNPQGEEQPLFEGVIAEKIRKREAHLDETPIYGFFIVDDERGLMVHESLSTDRARGISCSEGLDVSRRAQIFRFLEIPNDVEIPPGTTIKEMKEALASQYHFIDENDDDEIIYLYKFFLWKRISGSTGREDCQLLADALKEKGLIVYR